MEDSAADGTSRPMAYTQWQLAPTFWSVLCAVQFSNKLADSNHIP